MTNKSRRFPVNYLAGPPSLAAGRKIQSLNFVPSLHWILLFSSLNILNFLLCVSFLSFHICRAAGDLPSLPLIVSADHLLLFATESRRYPRIPLFRSPPLVYLIFYSFRGASGLTDQSSGFYAHVWSGLRGFPLNAKQWFKSSSWDRFLLNVLSERNWNAHRDLNSSLVYENKTTE